jgi:1A family penicillin-binding protein
MFRRPRRWWEWIAVAVLTVVVAGAALSAWWMARYAVAVHRLTRGVGDTVFYGADGQPWFRLDEQRHDVPLYDIAAHLQHAVVAVEDRRFYSHPGIDPIGLARAVVRNVQSGARAEGGSTLTQQLARTLFLSNVRSFARKAKEASIAILIEVQLTKDQILELYLNRVYLSAGVYGVEAMSEHLFRKPAKALTLPEAALVAGLIRAPSTLSPWTNYEGALQRSRTVLALMREQGFITADEERGARDVRPRIQPYRSPADPRAGWAKDWLRQQFRNQFGGDHPPDWRVQTSFVPALQEAAEQAVAGGVRRLNRAELEAAFVAIDPATGDVLALVGGADYTRSTYNRATRARRQPGSAFKPLVYTAALAKGYSPVSVLSGLDDVGAPDDPEWHPRNVLHVEGLDLSAVTLREALSESNNAAAVVLQQRVGSRDVIQLADRAGLHDLPDVASLALGSGLVSPLDLTAAYTMFPGGGEVVRPRGIINVFDADGDSTFYRPVDRQRLVSEQVAFQMTSMLRDVVEHGTAAQARALGVTGPVGGKTGTTDAYHDAWFVGFSSSVVVGVWVGFDKPDAIGRDAYAARVALPIWADFMKRTAGRLPRREFDIPAGIQPLELCGVSHLKPVDGCPVYTEYFKSGDDVPSRLCSVHQGTLRQAAARVLQNVFRSIGSRIAGIFRR